MKLTREQYQQIQTWLQEPKEVVGTFTMSEKGEITMEKLWTVYRGKDSVDFFINNPSCTGIFHTHPAQNDCKNGRKCGYDPPSRQDMAHFLQGSFQHTLVFSSSGFFVLDKKKKLCKQCTKFPLLERIVQLQSSTLPSETYNQSFVDLFKTMCCVHIKYTPWVKKMMSKKIKSILV